MLEAGKLTQESKPPMVQIADSQASMTFEELGVSDVLYSKKKKKKKKKKKMKKKKKKLTLKK